MKILNFLVFTGACIISMVYCESQQRMCFFGKGNICDPSLKGYIKCDGNDPWGEYHACKETEMCSCGKTHQCPSDQVLCVPRPQFSGSQIPKDFTVTFHGKLTITKPGVETEVRKISGNIRESLEKGKEILREAIKFKTEDGTPIKDVIRITKNENRHGLPNAIVQYTYHKDAKTGKESCDVRNTRGQVDFFHDLRNFSYKKQYTTDEYFFTDGPARPHAASTLKKWVFRQFHPSQPKCPSKFYKIKHGSNNNKGTEEETINFHYFYLTRPRPDFFRLPGECLKLVTYHDQKQDESKRELDDERAADIERELEMDFHKLF